MQISPYCLLSSIFFILDVPKLDFGTIFYFYFKKVIKNYKLVDLTRN